MHTFTPFLFATTTVYIIMKIIIRVYKTRGSRRPLFKPLLTRKCFVYAFSGRCTHRTLVLHSLTDSHGSLLTTVRYINLSQSHAQVVAATHRLPSWSLDSIIFIWSFRGENIIFVRFVIASKIRFRLATIIINEYAN